MLLEDIISFQNVGLIGVSFYVLSYAGLQLGLLSGSGNSYTLMNLAAASLVLISLMETYNQSAALIQIIWIFMSLFGLLRRAILHHSTKLAPHERVLTEAKLPGISRADARRFLDRGMWETIPKGTVVVREGEVFGALGWVSDGDLQVSVAGRDVGHIPRGAFFGELTVLNGEPATATVTAVKDTQIFRMRADTLKRLCVGNSQLAALIQLSIGLDAKGKLETANNQIANL